MSDSIIEHGIPIPPKEQSILEREFPELLALEVGDSFVVDAKRFPMHVSIAIWGSLHNQRHEIREMANHDFRIWRIL